MVPAMSTPTFDDLVRAQRACPTFRPDPVPDELVEWVLDLAARAPAGGDEGRAFVVVRSPEGRAALGASDAPVAIVATAAAGAASVHALLGVQNLLLAAQATGLGVRLGEPAAAAGSAPLGLPAAVDPVAVVALGRPATTAPTEPPQPRRAVPFEALTHRERFGEPWDGVGGRRRAA